MKRGNDNDSVENQSIRLKSLFLIKCRSQISFETIIRLGTVKFGKIVHTGMRPAASLRNIRIDRYYIRMQQGHSMPGERITGWLRIYLRHSRLEKKVPECSRLYRESLNKEWKSNSNLFIIYLLCDMHGLLNQLLWQQCREHFKDSIFE